MSAYESLLGAVHLPFSLRYAIAGEMYLHSFLKTETGGCTVSDRYVPAHHRSVCSTGTDHRGMWRIRLIEFVVKSSDSGRSLCCSTVVVECDMCDREICTM